MATAVGTSLLVIAMKSAAGLAGYLHSVHIHRGLALAGTAAAVVGSVLGGRPPRYSARSSPVCSSTDTNAPP